LDYIYRLLPMYSRIGAAAYKKDLTNTLALLAALGNPHEKLKFVHVAGTNGKGTVSHIVAFGLQQQGLKVGLYTSPHYKDFRERIKINGAYVSKQYIVDFIKENKLLIEEIKPSFFEITVAMAFDYFAKKKVDIAVIEVGLGGRLDSTNVITPLLSVITNISFDHMDMLGNTLPKIAKEKAGIIKKNVPLIIGERQAAVERVFITAAKKEQSPLYFAEQLVAIEEQKSTLLSKALKVQVGSKSLKLSTNLVAPYHNRNIVTALAVLSKLAEQMDINFKPIANNFIKLSEEVSYMGRWQIMSKSPIVIFDSAHNEAGLQLAMTALANHKSPKIHFVIGFVKDKSLKGVLKLFPQNAVYYFVKADIPRGLDATLLMEEANRYGLIGKTYSSVKAGYKAALKNCSKNELIYVGGSIFVTSELL
jgi:dihydrofolate synthase / folylpolyglutamate synthase